MREIIKDQSFKEEDSKPLHELKQVFLSSWKSWVFGFQRLPSLLFWGIRVRYIDHYRTEVSLPYNWFTKNPFRSIYFAAQCGAGELSTGILALLAVRGKGKISMLITNMEAEFTKKADSKTTFTCRDGALIEEAVERAITTKEGQKVTVQSIGVKETGEVVSRINVTWSFKAKG